MANHPAFPGAPRGAPALESALSRSRRVPRRGLQAPAIQGVFPEIPDALTDQLQIPCPEHGPASIALAAVDVALAAPIDAEGGARARTRFRRARIRIPVEPEPGGRARVGVDVDVAVAARAGRAEEQARVAGRER